MAQPHDSADIRGAARSELCALLDRFEQPGLAKRPGEIGALGDAVRRLARASGMEPLSRLALALGNVLAEGGQAAAIRPYVEAMRDAIECEMQDEETARTILAAATIRFAG